MKKRVSIVVMVLASIVWPDVKGQDNRTPTTRELQQLYREATSDTVRLELLHQIGKSYMFRFPRVPENQDSAIAVLKKAIEMATAMQWSSPRLENTCRMAEAHLRKGDFATARRIFLQVIDEYHRAGDKEREARTWLRYADKSLEKEHQSQVENEVPEMLTAALQLYQDAGNELRVADVYFSWAHFHVLAGTPAEALVHLDKAFQHAGAKLDANRTASYNAFYVTIYQNMGNYNKALKVALELSKTAFPNQRLRNWYQSEIGFIYLELGQPEKCIEWLTPPIANMKAEGAADHIFYWCIAVKAEALIRLRRVSEASAMVKEINAALPPPDYGKPSMARANAVVSEATGLHKDAERFYTLSLRYASEVDNPTWIAQAEHDLGKFYRARQQYALAIPHLANSGKNLRGWNALSRRMETYLLLSQAEEAMGNSGDALTYHRLHKALSDSIFNITKSYQIEELSMQYEAVKKQKEIDVLTSEVELKQARLTAEVVKRNSAIGITALVVVLLGFVANSLNRNKKQTRRLTEQQAEIRDKNALLNQHIADKDRLLSDQHRLLNERERLLREVHHRVKNNLQIVISLLDSQAASLKDFKALSAIKESQHRVQTMALIHQKLHQAEGMTRIPMQSYVSEVVAFLRDSLALSETVKFKLEIQDVELDVSQAVPLGLIINESLTNALKYAFPNERTGEITVRLDDLSEGNYRLEISDDGVGLPEGFDPFAARTLGMTLIIGFSRQLKGQLAINSPGCKTTLLFRDTGLTPVEHELTTYSLA